MPNHQLLNQIGVAEGQAFLALLVGYPVLRFLARLPGRTIRYRLLLAELERPVPVGTSFVIRWDQFKFKTKAFLLYDTAQRAWQYTGQQITDDGWELLFVKAETGAKLRRHREAAAGCQRTSGVDVLDRAALEARAAHTCWYAPHSRWPIISMLGIVGVSAALVLTLGAVLHGALPAWLLLVWIGAAVMALVGSGVAAYCQPRMANAVESGLVESGLVESGPVEGGG